MSIMEELAASDPDVKLDVKQNEPPADPPAEPEGAKPDAGLENKSDTPDKSFDPKTYFKEKLGIDYEDDEKFKERYSSLTIAEQKAAELESQIAAKDAERQKLTIEYEDTFKKKYNLNDNEIRRLLILKEYPDSDPNLLTKVITTDYTKAVKEDPLEVLIAKVRLDDPDIFDNDEDAEAEVYRMFHIDLNEKKKDEDGNVETDDDGKPIYLYKDKDGTITIPTDKVKAMQKAAKEANKKFEEIRNKIPIPDKTNLAEEKAKLTKDEEDKINRLTNQWTPTFKNLPDKALGKIKFERKTEDGKKSEVFFEFDVDENFKKEAAKVLMETDLKNFVSRGTEYSKEVEQAFVGKATESLQNRYLTKQTVTAMLTAFETQLRKKIADEEHDTLHNPLKNAGRVGPKVTPEIERKHNAVDDEIGKRY
jgi:hypothetical protein